MCGWYSGIDFVSSIILHAASALVVGVSQFCLAWIPSTLTKTWTDDLPVNLSDIKEKTFLILDPDASPFLVGHFRLYWEI